jgi:lipid-A-disaccharide synthase
MSLRLYFVVGESSGDALGADLLDCFKRLKVDVEPLGLGGPKMQAHGLNPIFPSSEIAIMGISGVVTRLPSLLKRVRQVADDIIRKQPDAVLLIDSPDFAKQVARRVKSKMPDIKVIKYVCPTVWSWRPGRAVKMNAYCDHVLAILPFEPTVMRELGGPPTTYIGHPLAKLAGVSDLKAKLKPKKPPHVMLLPGSRKSEVSRLLPIMKTTVDQLRERGLVARFTLPAVPHLEDYIREATRTWLYQPEILSGEDAKLEAMQDADAAIAASGTAILELAMYGVPCVSIYKPDPALNALRFLIKAWTGALPNLIADKVIVPERINEFAHPGYIARLIEALLVSGPERQAQIRGFELVHKIMQQERAPGEIAVEIILQMADGQKARQ